VSNYDYDGWVANPKVFVEDGYMSPVLDPTGEPFLVKKKNTVGFDLTKRSSNESKK
jgi:hypothetical protein